MRVKPVKVFIIAFLLFIMNTAFVFSETIKVGVYQNLPLVGVDEAGEAVGFFVDLMNYIAAEENLDIDYEYDFLENNFDKIESGEIDLLLTVAFTEERAEKYLFSKETVYTNWGQIYSNHDSPIDSMLDLEGKKVGVEKGDIHYDGPNGIRNLFHAFNINVDFEEYPGRIEMFDDLDNNKVDVIVVSRLFGEYYEVNYDIHPTPIQFNPIKIKVITGSEDKQYLLDLFDVHIVAMKNDPSSLYYNGLNNLLNSKVDFELPENIENLLMILISFLIAAGFTIIWGKEKIKNQNSNISRQNEQLKLLIDNISDLTIIKNMELLFEAFVSQLSSILNQNNLDVVSIIKFEDGYYLDTEAYVAGKYKISAGKSLEESMLVHLNDRQLDDFDRGDEKIVFHDDMVLVKYESSYNRVGFIYIETDQEIVEKEYFKVYMMNLLLNLQSIISNIARNREKTKLFISLGEIIEKRDVSVASHVKRVSQATKILAEACGYSEERTTNIVIASSVHDIGKIYVPDSILNKPGKLTDEEFEIIKTHATDDFRILDDVSDNLSMTVHDVVRYHHENWDGTGYPEGLAGTSIPHEARIVSIIDVFEALTHVRPYKEAWSFERAIQFVNMNRGIKFDPNIVDAFLSRSSEIEKLFDSLPD